MASSYKKLYSFLVLVFGFGLITSVIAVYKIKKNNGLIESNSSVNIREIYVISPSFFEKQAISISKLYSAKSFNKVSINFVEDSEIDYFISNLHNESHILFGYSYKDGLANIPHYKLDNQKIIGVTNNSSQYDRQALCDIEYMSSINKLPIYISNSSKGIISELQEKYKKSCLKICDTINDRFSVFTDIDPMTVVMGNYSDYIVVSKDLVPDLLMDNNFLQYEFFDIIFYIHTSNRGKINSEELTLYDLISFINKNNINLVVYDAVYLKDIQNRWNVSCYSYLPVDKINVEYIDSNDFYRKEGVLFGFEGELLNYSESIVYLDEDFNTALWAYCLNVNDENCKAMLKFLKNNSAVSKVLKKYKIAK